MSDFAYLVHHAYQNHHIQPGIYMGLRTPQDPVPLGERVFMMASDMKALKEGDTPVKVRNFTERSDDGQ